MVSNIVCRGRRLIHVVCCFIVSVTMKTCNSTNSIASEFAAHLLAVFVLIFSCHSQVGSSVFADIGATT